MLKIKKHAYKDIINIYYIMTNDLFKSKHLHPKKRDSLIKLLNYNEELFINPPLIKNPLKIAIIGGGVAGLTTALTLQKMNFTDVRVYESDDNVDSRPQGYSFTIQETIPFLQKLNIAKTILESNLKNESQIWCKSDGTILRQKLNNCQNRWSIPLPRQQLRLLLLEQLNSQTMQWNKRVTSFIKTNNNQVNIKFSDNTSVMVDLMIIADGMRSNLREQLIGNKLNYTGYMMINGINQHYNKFYNKEYMIFDGKVKLFIKPFSTTESMWELTYAHQNSIPFINNHDALNEALSMMQGWDPLFYNFIKSTSPNRMRYGLLHDRDPDSTFNFSTEPYTIIGDAAHAMTPFVGQGANNALWDSLTLVYHLVKEMDLIKALRESEEDMLDRSRYFVDRSRECVKFYHTDKILDQKYIEMFLNHDTDFL